MITRVCTGKWFLKKRFFGGYTIYVEVTEHCFCPDDMTCSPDIIRWKKADIYDLYELDLTGEQNRYEPETK